MVQSCEDRYFVSPLGMFVTLISAASLVVLALLGAIEVRASGANIIRATARVTFGES